MPGKSGGPQVRARAMCVMGVVWGGVRRACTWFGCPSTWVPPGPGVCVYVWRCRGARLVCRSLCRYVCRGCVGVYVCVRVGVMCASCVRRVEVSGCECV